MVIYADRNGNKKEGETGQDRLLAFVYGHGLTRLLVKPLVSPVVSRIGGWMLDRRVSTIFIDPFVRKKQHRSGRI